MTVRRPGLVVAVAILLSLPMAPGILDGAISGTTALVRFLIALLLCWAGGALIGSVMRRYGEQARRAEVVALMDAARRQAAERAQARPESIPPSSDRQT